MAKRVYPKAVNYNRLDRALIKEHARDIFTYHGDECVNDYLYNQAVQRADYTLKHANTYTKQRGGQHTNLELISLSGWRLAIPVIHCGDNGKYGSSLCRQSRYCNYCSNKAITKAYHKFKDTFYRATHWFSITYSYLSNINLYTDTKEEYLSRYKEGEAFIKKLYKDGMIDGATINYELHLNRLATGEVFPHIHAVVNTTDDNLPEHVAGELMNSLGVSCTVKPIQDEYEFYNQIKYPYKSINLRSLYEKEAVEVSADILNNGLDTILTLTNQYEHYQVKAKYAGNMSGKCSSYIGNQTKAGLKKRALSQKLKSAKMAKDMQPIINQRPIAKKKTFNPIPAVMGIGGLGALGYALYKTKPNFFAGANVGSSSNPLTINPTPSTPMKPAGNIGSVMADFSSTDKRPLADKANILSGVQYDIMNQGMDSAVDLKEDTSSLGAGLKAFNEVGHVPFTDKQITPFTSTIKPKTWYGAIAPGIADWSIGSPAGGLITAKQIASKLAPAAGATKVLSKLAPVGGGLWGANSMRELSNNYKSIMGEDADKANLFSRAVSNPNFATAVGFRGGVLPGAAGIAMPMAAMMSNSKLEAEIAKLQSMGAEQALNAQDADFMLRLYEGVKKNQPEYIALVKSLLPDRISRINLGTPTTSSWVGANTALTKSNPVTDNLTLKLQRLLKEPQHQ